MAALVAVGLCSGLIGLAVGRASSWTSVERPPAPALQSDQTAVTTPVAAPVVRIHPDNEKQAARAASREAQSPLQREHPDSPTSAPAVAKRHDQSLAPASPPVVLLNPGAGNQTVIGENRVAGEARPLLQKRPDTPNSATAVAKKNDQDVPPARSTAIVRLPREQTRSRRAHVSNEPGRSKEPRAFRPERPATLADYRALRDYVMRH